MKMFEEPDPLLHAPLRLAVMSLLIGLKQADFTYIKEKTGATAGNLSAQLSRLQEVGYIDIEKGFKGKYPRTVCSITPVGVKAFEKYLNVIKQYLTFNDH